MEHRVKNNDKTLTEIKKICMKMHFVGIGLTLLGILGAVIFHETGKYLIHPAIYIMLCAMGWSTGLTATYVTFKAKKEYWKKDIKYWMTKDEAYEAMKNGQKVAHEYFDSSEYLYMNCDIIYCNEGYDFDDGWALRDGPEWQKGWRIYGTAQRS